MKSLKITSDPIGTLSQSLFSVIFIVIVLLGLVLLGH